MDKFREDLQALAQRSDVICLQEVGPKFQTTVFSLFYAMSWHCEIGEISRTAIGLRNSAFEVPNESGGEHSMFSDDKDRKNKYRGWRKYLKVQAFDKDMNLWNIVSGHIVSGSHDSETERHRIPGSTPNKKEVFKRECFSQMVRGAFGQHTPVASREAQDFHFIVCGDLNMKTGSLREAVDADASFLSYLSLAGHSPQNLPPGIDDRDWIGSFGHSTFQSSDVQPVISWSKDHASVSADIVMEPVEIKPPRPPGLPLRHFVKKEYSYDVAGERDERSRSPSVEIVASTIQERMRARSEKVREILEGVCRATESNMDEFKTYGQGWEAKLEEPQALRNSFALCPFVRSTYFSRGEN